ncbi:MAG TPA: hypothetical protein EYG71_04210 [Leucothrix sp.]|nr:hypothetical protein [Leucothrix sp.]
MSLLNVMTYKRIDYLLFSLLIAMSLSLVACGMNKRNASNYFSDPIALEMAEAIDRSDTQAIKKLAKNIDINTKGKRGMTFLIWAMGGELIESYKTLLSLGIDTEAGLIGEEDSITTPLDIATGLELPWMKLLLEAGSDINQHIGRPRWWGASLGNNWEVFDYLLLQPELDINAQSSSGYTEIMNLAGHENYKQVLKLLNKGADIHLTTRRGNSFAYRVQTSVPHKNHKQFPYYQQVLKFLKGKGIVFPVKGPRELRGEKVE